MPVAIVGAAISGAVAAATALPWLAAGAFIKAFATSLILGALSSALTPKPKKPSSIKQVDSQTFAVRQPDEPRKHVYGMTRVADIFAHLTTTSNNEKLHAFIVLNDDTNSSLIEVWANDYVIPADAIDATGNVTSGRYAGKLRIRFHDGSQNQVADSVAVSEIPEWTNDHRGRGVSYLFVTMTKDRDIYPNGMPNFSAVVRGPPKLDTRDSQQKFTCNMALFFNDYISQVDYGFQASAENMDDTNISANANICDEIVDTKPLDMEIDSVATSTGIITLDGDRLLFQIGDRVRITTTGAVPSGLATATDYYIIVYQTKDTPRVKLATTLDNAMAGVAIDLTSAGTGTNTVRKTGEPRYHGGGIINTADEMGDIINAMLNSMAGRAINTGGAWNLLAGAWRVPTVELTLSDLRGKMGYRRPIAMAEKFNVIKGKHISPLNNYQPTDYPVIRYQTFIDQDGGVEYPPRELSLSLTPRPTTCQRIANIELFRSRQDIIFNAPFSETALRLQSGSTTELTIDELGWAQKDFEVTDFVLSTGGGGPNPRLLCTLTLRETAEEIYTWDENDDLTIDPAPNTELPDVYNVTVPTGVGFSSTATDTLALDIVYNLTLMWDVHPNAFVVQGGQFEIQYKLSADVDWLPSFFVDGALTESAVVNSSVNIPYDLRIRAVNRLGVRSNWVTLTGAVAGSSGGVGATDNWQTFQDVVTVTDNWQTFQDAVTVNKDWGYFT